MKIIVFILLALPVFALSQNTEAHYTLYNTNKKSQASVETLIADMAKADVLFFGEEHNDSTGHILELAILTKLNLQYPGKVALSMEMFETDCQEVVNEYLKGLISEKNFLTDARTWPNYSDYRPLIEFAKQNNIPVMAANAPGRYVSMVNRKGLKSLDQLSATGKSYLPPLPVDTAAGPYYDKFLQVMGGHAIAGIQMYQAQSLWDATMGWSIAKFWKTHAAFKILQINGGFHSEEKLGAVSQLKHYVPGIRILNIAAYSGENISSSDWSKYLKQGDYILLTGSNTPGNPQ